jgi:hypothetical protein
MYELSFFRFLVKASAVILVKGNSVLPNSQPDLNVTGAQHTAAWDEAVFRRRVQQHEC